MEKVKQYSPVSIALIAISAAVALSSNLGASQDVLQSLYISNPSNQGLQDILSGQIWRLITPIFIHFGMMHFGFNMMWVWDLGKWENAGARHGRCTHDYFPAHHDFQLDS